uniref:Uncharacterized protein n=1 Tax=Anguilla anguilla TaxID=7936 RepID=A0A0E9QQ30_ANGAN
MQAITGGQHGTILKESNYENVCFIFPIFTGKKTQQSMGWHQGEQSEEKEGFVVVSSLSQANTNRCERFSAVPHVG